MSHLPWFVAVPTFVVLLIGVVAFFVHSYDLTVARADNEVDMRYMINMDYSSDLPINTMGRRVRTRLYVSSTMMDSSAGVAVLD